ncbi:lipoyl synthase [Chlorobium sp. N1]|uniref:lipoyl synthase n=1 Tax=Chlorobium sp. N1 TaxID=2491138 RepID=UPI00103CA3AF|nr:lipoyl synthase [Chlorobium sp. N1]TCD47419.1 lipoyl synthase [Chlorobium sp. N1]
MEDRSRRKPEWLKQRLVAGEAFGAVQRLLSSKGIHTVCRSAKCPNLQECWSQGTATFLLLGNVCTRSCRFCAIDTSRIPPAPESDEPQRVADAAGTMKLRFVVLTSVNRDDLQDGGASHWTETIQAIRRTCPEAGIECLIPDFAGNAEALHSVCIERPDVLNHNIETVPRLYSKVRPQAVYLRSLSILERAASEYGLNTKSGLMVGMGETFEEVEESLRDLACRGCRMVTIGQYLQPTAAHLPVERYVTPQEFARYRDSALSLGFLSVQSGPFVRSSYHAAESSALCTEVNATQ